MPSKVMTLICVQELQFRRVSRGHVFVELKKTYMFDKKFNLEKVGRHPHIAHEKVLINVDIGGRDPCLVTPRPIIYHQHK